MVHSPPDEFSGFLLVCCFFNPRVFPDDDSVFSIDMGQGALAGSRSFLVWGFCVRSLFPPGIHYCYMSFYFKDLNLVCVILFSSQLLNPGVREDFSRILSGKSDISFQFDESLEGGKKPVCVLMAGTVAYITGGSCCGLNSCCSETLKFFFYPQERKTPPLTSFLINRKVVFQY